MKQNKKIIKRVILIVLASIILIQFGLFTFHVFYYYSDIKFLKEKGYYSPTEFRNKNINLVRFGNKNGKGKIVVISGMGAGMPVDLRVMSKELEDDYEFIFIGRYGWDGSDDINGEENVEDIVYDYRKLLEDSGSKGPYILMSHSMGGVYASYWVSKYPEDAKAFINIDGTYVEAIPDVEKPSASGANPLYKAAITFGLGDIFIPKLLENEYGLPEDEWKAYCILQKMSIASDAVANEGRMIDYNRNATWEVLKETDVPKLYISSRDGDLSDPQSEAANKKELLPYLEKMGNCEIAYLPGSHFIYKTEPEECRKIIENFLNSIE